MGDATILAWSSFSNIIPPRNLTKISAITTGMAMDSIMSGRQETFKPSNLPVTGRWCSICGSSGMLHGRGTWIEQSNGSTQPSLLMLNITPTRLATTMMGVRNIKTNLPRPPTLQWLLQLFTGANRLPHIIKCFGKSFDSEIQCYHCH